MQKSDDLLLTLFEQAPQAILILNQNDEIVHANDKAVSLFCGSSEDTLVRCRFTETMQRIVPDFDQYPCVRQSSVENNKPLPTLELIDGRAMEVQCSELSFGTEDYVLVQLRCVLQQRHMQWDRHLAEVADVLEYLPEPIMVVDLTGMVVVWNKAIEDVTGVKKQDIIGKGNEEYSLAFYGIRRPILIDWALNPSNNRVPIEEYDSVRRNEETLYGEIYTPNALGGKGAYLWGVAAPLRDSSGKVVAAVECIRNVTERKMVEQELNNAKMAAEAATKAKSEFLARMSHEIRTPMNAILGMSELLQETALNHEQQNFSEVLHSSGEMLLGIINDILDFSKIEADQLELERTPFALDRITEEVVQIFMDKAARKGLAFTSHIAADVQCSVLGDPVRFKQILINLLSNAIKFTEHGQVQLDMSLAPGKPDVILVSVSDSGIGIPESSQYSVFDCFSQADTSTTRQFGGTGLGLAITKRLIELMGGRIWVQSYPGQGSTFFFTIQFEHSELPYELPRPLNCPMDKPCFEQLQLLLVEDIETNRKMVTLFLDKTGIQITEATNGQMAVNAYIQAHGGFDMILMDKEMPVMDGLTATRTIRDFERKCHLPRTPIVALTAHAFMQHKEECLRVGCDGFLSKPVKKKALINVLTNVMLQCNEPAHPLQDEACLVEMEADLRELVPDFLQELEDEMTQMASAIELRQFDELHRLAHGYKGAARNYGVLPLAELYWELEQAARARDSSQCHRIWAEARTFISRMQIRFIES